MTESDKKLITGDAEAIEHLKVAILAGKHWYMALLESMGLWTTTEETYEGREYRYLIDGEAFDWLLLAERLTATADGLIPERERNALVFQGRPPVTLSAAEVKRLIGQSKYRQYLNYFYGVTIEGMLVLAVEEEVQKERQALRPLKEQEVVEEAYQRIYDTSRAELLLQFRKVKRGIRTRSMNLNELKEFTYWLFKYRIEHSEKARVASDTKKALAYLKRQWQKKGLFGALATDQPCPM